MLNAISIDVEEYFHAANLEPYIPREKWNDQVSRLSYSVNKTLDILDASSTKATFFILGSLVKKHSKIIQSISKAGHEIASHGFNHKLVYQQTSDEFFEDINSTKKALEDCTQRKVVGYRAPNFSITDKCSWAYEKLIEAGYKYDSSIYPIWHPRYANTDKSTAIEIKTINSKKIIEVPLSVYSMSVGNLKLPIAGGAYWRFLPTWLIKSLLSKREVNCCYFHPWELDTNQPLVDNIKLLTKFRHSWGTKSFDKKLSNILRSFSFVPIQELLKKKFSNSIFEIND